MFQRLIVAAIAALCVQAASAEPPTSGYSAEYTACQAQSGGVDKAMLDCANAEYAHQDKRLDDAHKSLTRHLKPKLRAALKTSQRDWIRSRQSTCDMFYKVGGGTSAHLEAQSCYLDSLVERATLLEHWKYLDEASR